MDDGPKWATIVGVTIIALFVLAVFAAMILGLIWLAGVVL